MTQMQLMLARLTSTKCELFTNRRILVWVCIFVLIGAADLLLSLTVGPLAVFAAAFLFTLCLILSNHPRAALIIWIGAIAFVPFWVGVEAGAYLSPGAALAVVVLPALRKGVVWKFNRIDILALILIGTCTFAGVVGLSRVGDLSTVVSQWLLGFIVGRFLVQRAGYIFALKSLVAIFSFVGLLAIIEFLLGWNPYMSLIVNNDYYRVFGRLQPRGEIFRAEWSFGHSIALGHALVLVLPLAIGLNYRPSTKIVLVALLLGGVFVTFSRSAQFSAVFAIVLTVFFVRSIGLWQRILILSGGIVAVAVALPIIDSVLSNAGAEASHSVDYRRDLLGLIPTMRPLGIATNASEDSSNVVVFSDFGSIDSTFLFLGLRFGALPALLAIVCCVVIGVAVLRSKASLPLISLAAIMPGIFTASLITQYGMLVWFYIGLASAAMWNEHQDESLNRSSEKRVNQLA